MRLFNFCFKATYEGQSQNDLENRVVHWKRIVLLITAITIHNIPEGLAGMF